jgi:hypothetical protein
MPNKQVKFTPAAKSAASVGTAIPKSSGSPLPKSLTVLESIWFKLTMQNLAILRPVPLNHHLLARPNNIETNTQ